MTEKIIMSADETETIINFSKYHIGDWAELYTTDKVVMKRYEKFAAKYPEHCKLIKEDQYSMTYTVHPKCVGIYPRAPRFSHFTPEQQRLNAERLRSRLQDNIVETA